MSSICKSAGRLIGRTPLPRLVRVEEAGARARVVAKLERLNPAGSAKERIAGAMIDESKASGRLRPGPAITGPASGNTGIGLSSVQPPRDSGSSSPCRRP